jgi:hypothetical protein
MLANKETPRAMEHQAAPLFARLGWVNPHVLPKNLARAGQPAMTKIKASGFSRRRSSTSHQVGATQFSKIEREGRLARIPNRPTNELTTPRFRR